MLPVGFYIFVVAIFGLVIGSFLNVVIYRLHTGRSLNDRSHCLSCGRQLEWYELLPLVSYLALRGRCRTCQSLIPYRYALVESLTAAAFVMAYLKAVSVIEFLFLAAILSVLIVGLVYDFYHMIIPDEVSLGAAGLALAFVIWSASAQGGWEILIVSGFGAIAAFLAYASLWYFSRGRAFGFGDAKLAVSLGLLTGIYGVFSLVVLSFWIGALASLILISWQRIVLNINATKRGGQRVNMKSEVPFAPFLLASFILVYFGSVNVLALIEALYVGF